MSLERLARWVLKRERARKTRAGLGVERLTLIRWYTHPEQFGGARARRS